MDPYVQFLARKLITDPMTGLDEVPPLPDCLFPHQRDIVTWALRRGRAALFAGTGLGKSLMELAWAQAVHQATGANILHLAPLAVSAQMVREADKFGIPARIVTCQADCGPGINITNYQKLDHFDVGSFGGIILDESSILKNTDGHYRTKLIDACQSIPFRLAATATPAPNDFMELGNHAEFLGIMSYTDMLATFFVHDGGDTQKWRLKGHAENEFWKWMASWSVMLRKPSDLGYPNDGYDLPPLNFEQHIVAADYAPDLEMGTLFPMQAQTLSERIAARRSTVEARCEKAASIVTADLWDKLAECHGNQNTPPTDSQKLRLIQNMLSAASGRQSLELPTKTANTCEHTTPPTKTSGTSGRRSSRRNTIESAASDTPQTRSIESSKRQLSGADARSPNAIRASKANTGSQSNNTQNLSASRADVALYAQEAPASLMAAGSPSITVTKPELSEACSAETATVPSDCSETAATCSIEQSSISPKLDQWVIWCHLNSEQDFLSRAFGNLCFSVSGSDSEDEKERRILAWLAGERPILISKPGICGFGMNFQCCNKTMFVGLNDSFEQFYQAVRRFWRFGQTKPVTAHIIASELEGATLANIKRKEADADRMAAAMVMHMADLSSQAVRGSVRETPNYNPTIPVQLPSFLENVA